MAKPKLTPKKTRALARLARLATKIGRLATEIRETRWDLREADLGEYGEHLDKLFGLCIRNENETEELAQMARKYGSWDAQIEAQHIERADLQRAEWRAKYGSP